MPPLLLSLLLKIVLPEVLKLLVSAKIISQLEADGINGWEALKVKLSNIKFYRDFPNDPPGQTNISNLGVQQP